MATVTNPPQTQQYQPPGALDIARIREDFPILSREINGHKLTFLDSAASSQKPLQVTRAINEYYEKHHANVHRGMYTLAAEATDLYEASREKVAGFIKAPSPRSIIFTRNATEAINLVAYSWGEGQLRPGNEIVISRMEHHANLVPWVRLAKKTGAVLKTIPVNNEGRLDISGLDDIITGKTRIVALTRMSNVLGTIVDTKPVFDKARAVGAVTLVDAAQSAPHLQTDVRELDCDFLALSAHKMLGPTGVGVLYGREELLENMPPFMSGGEMIDRVSFDEVTYNELPHKFEAGTPNIAGVVAFGAALDYLTRLGMENVRAHEVEITGYALSALSRLEWITIVGPKDNVDRGAAISFLVDGVHPHDVSQFLDSFGVAVRAGHHCAQPLMRELAISATTRCSMYIYNTHDEVDRLVAALTECYNYFRP